MHGLLQDLQLVVEFCKEGALAQRPRDEATLQLVGDMVASRDLLLGVGGLRQQLRGKGKTRMTHSIRIKKWIKEQQRQKKDMFYEIWTKRVSG